MPTIIRTHRVIAFTVMITLSAIFFQAHGIPETLALEQSEDLSLWRGKVKNILMDYIYDVSTPGSKDFIPSKDRIAVFDMDGTLMSERPRALSLMRPSVTWCCIKRNYLQKVPCTKTSVKPLKSLISSICATT